MKRKKPRIIVVSGFSSGTGKTRLVCEMLSRNEGWEAIKVSKGHYRSCGRDPVACCVSPLLGDSPSILSGHSATYFAGKDTGRYWEAGASNVHWLICSKDQLSEGIEAALSRVVGETVVIEGTGVMRHVEPDYSVMAVGIGDGEIKSSAVWALGKVDAFFWADAGDKVEFCRLLEERIAARAGGHLRIKLFCESEIDLLCSAAAESIPEGRRL